jgi:predicted porin
MKKSLFALAAVGAFAGAAQAQSSVTVYGILDTGWAGGNQRISGIAGPGTSGSSTSNGAPVAATWSQFQGNGGESTSRLGFRGTEDIGGGTSANFVFETALTPNTVSFTPEIRQAWAGLAQKGLGAARIGTQNTLIWQLAAPMTVGQLNNFSGSVINATSVGAPMGDAAGASTAAAFTNRTQRTIQIDSERIAGFQGKAMYMLNNYNSTQIAQGSSTLGYIGGTNNFNGWGVSLDFTGVPKLRVAAAYQSFNGQNPYGATQTQINNGGVGTPSSSANYTTGNPSACGTSGAAFVNTLATNGALTAAAAGNCINVRDNQTYAAAMYDFGILTAYVNYVNRQVTSQQTSNVFLKRSAQEIGVRGNVTKTIRGWASVGTGRFSAFGANQPTANIVGYQVGTDYIMSKRTNLYAIFGSVNTSSTNSGVLNSANINNYGVGVRHTF